MTWVVFVGGMVFASLIWLLERLGGAACKPDEAFIRAERYQAGFDAGVAAERQFNQVAVKEHAP